MGTSVYTACLVSGSPLVSGLTCTAATQLSSTIFAVTLDRDTAPSPEGVAQLLNFDINTATAGGTFIDPVSISIRIVRGQTRVWTLSEKGTVPFKYEVMFQLNRLRSPATPTACSLGDLLNAASPCDGSDCGAVLPVPNPCAPITVHQCAGSDATRDNLLTTAGFDFFRPILAYSVVDAFLPVGGPSLALNCGGGIGCGTTTNKYYQNFWIGPIYTLLAAQGTNFLSYQIEFTITKFSDPGNPVVLVVGPDGPSALTLNVANPEGTVGIKVFNVNDPVGAAPPPFPGLFVAPLDDAPYKFDGKGEFDDQYINPRSPTNKPLPKWFYESSTADYYLGTAGCTLNGLKQDWHGLAANQGGFPQCDKDHNGCVPSIGGGKSTRERLFDRFNVYDSNALAVGLGYRMPDVWRPADPNMWIFKTGSENRLYWQPPSGSAVTASVQVVVTGVFSEILIGSAEGIILPFPADPCTTTEGTESGTLFVDTQSTGLSGSFRLSITCTGSIGPVGVPSVEFTMDPPPAVTSHSFAMSAPSGTANTAANCLVTLEKADLIGFTVIDTASTACTIFTLSTVAPGTLSPTPPGGGTTGSCSGISAIGTFFTDPAECIPFLDFLGDFAKFLPYICIACCVCCCLCCCCVLCFVVVLPMLGPALAGGAAATGAEFLGVELPALAEGAVARLPEAAQLVLWGAADHAERSADFAANLIERTLGRQLYGPPRPRAWAPSTADLAHRGGVDGGSDTSDVELDVSSVRNWSRRRV